MGTAVGLACIRCGATYSLASEVWDCDRCRAVAPANLTVQYATPPRLRPDVLAGRPPTLWRYAEALPVEPEEAVTLGEGLTPLIPLPRLAAELGVAALYVKDESRNPTWSTKDRLATVAISAARKLGARVIASSSSGNAGAAVAAYAARAGLPCVVVTFHGAAAPMVAQMRAYGAMVLTVRDKGDRWTLLEAGIRRFGWFPTSPFFAPAVGSNPLGVEGYKTLAYEIAEQLHWRPPEWCAVPVCYGDGLYGLWKGFEELRHAGLVATGPRLVAAEVFGSLGAALASGGDVVPLMPKTHDTIALSIGTTRSTYQALHAVRASGGTAVTVRDDSLLYWQARLASEGVYAEPSAVAPLSAVAALRARGRIPREASVVVVVTASGLKDVQPTARRLGEAPVVAADIEAAIAVLRAVYGFTP